MLEHTFVSWFFFALLSTLMMTLVNFGDKFVVESQVRHPFALLVYTSVVNLFFGVILWVLSGFQTFAADQTMMLLLAGMLTIGGAYFYFQAVMQEETSRVIVLLQIEPLFILILSILFFNERLSSTQFIGFVCIIVATVAISLQRSAQLSDETTKPPRLSKALQLMLLATMVWSFGVLLSDAALDQVILQTDPASGEVIFDRSALMGAIAISAVGDFLAGALLFLFRRPVRVAVQTQLRQNTWRNLVPIFGIEGLFILRQFVFYTALTLGTPALVSVVGSTSVFFGILFGWLLTVWRPHIFKEATGRTYLLQKVGWATVAFVGLLLVQ